MSDLYAVIGNPIGHTKSPLIHSSFAAATRQDLSYVAIEGPLGGFAQRVDQFRREDGRGLNVTAPFKLAAFAYATGNEAWKDPERLRDPNTAGYLRSLTRRMSSEANAMSSRWSPCLG